MKVVFQNKVESGNIPKDNKPYDEVLGAAQLIKLEIYLFCFVLFKHHTLTLT